MQETLEQKKRRLFGKQYLAEYLTIIKKITRYKSNDSIRLLTIVDSDNIISKGASLEKKFAIRIPFNNDELKRILIEKCIVEGSTYLYTDLSKDCGLVFLDSISDFNFDFNYEDEPVGLIILIGSKNNYKILLDFYEEDGLKFIEIEYYN